MYVCVLYINVIYLIRGGFSCGSISKYHKKDKVIQYKKFISSLLSLEIIIFVPITFKNPLKAYLSNNKYLITIQTRLKQILISIFLIKKPVFNGFLNIIGLQN